MEEVKEKLKRKSRYADVYPKASVLKMLVYGNPKMKNTKAFERFKAYTGARTVGEYLEQGGSYGDLVHDIGRQFVRVTVVR